jgi:Ca-activated chloride channel family protein
MQKLYRCLGLAATAASLGISGAPAAAPAAEPPSLIVVVDGSGSMAGLLEGGGKQNKSDLVREALRTELAKVGTQARVGLVAFGHRRRGCTDVELVRPAEPVDLEPMMTRIGQVRPNRGKGPLTLAVREAAKRLPQSSGPRGLLLIHDGADNCQADVCAAAAELGNAGVIAHVVSIGATPEDLAKMACLPQATGGRHFIAQNAGQLASYIGEAMRLASNQSAVAGFTTTIVPPAPVPASWPPALHLRAVLAPNNEPLSVPLYWTVSAEDQPEKALFRAWSANPVAPVAPGRYVVEARSGLATARDTVVVRENRPAAVALRLDAGTARVRAVAEGPGAPLPGAIFTISSGEEVDSPPLAVFKAGEAAPLLQAGRYHVRADLGRFRSKPQVLEVRAGEPAAVDIPLEAGRLQLTAETRDGIAPLESPVFIVTEDDPPHGKREVARSAARQAELVLPPNIYYVVARQGGVVARERVEIGSGDSVKVKLPLLAAAGRLGLSSTFVGPAGAGGDPVSYAIRRLDETQEEIVTSRPAPVLDLPRGRYRVEGRYGLTNVRTVREIDLAAGQTLQLSLEHRIGELRLRFTGAAAAGVWWEVHDADRRIVWTSAETETVATLQAGRYLVAMTTPGKHEERTLELRAGETELVELAGK